MTTAVLLAAYLVGILLVRHDPVRVTPRSSACCSLRMPLMNMHLLEPLLLMQDLLLQGVLLLLVLVLLLVLLLHLKMVLMLPLLVLHRLKHPLLLPQSPHRVAFCPSPRRGRRWRQKRTTGTPHRPRSHVPRVHHRVLLSRRMMSKPPPGCRCCCCWPCG